jgi:hypothetical protein
MASISLNSLLWLKERHYLNMSALQSMSVVFTSPNGGVHL